MTYIRAARAPSPRSVGTDQGSRSAVRSRGARMGATPCDVERIMDLQRTVGNRVVTNLLDPGPDGSAPPAPVDPVVIARRIQRYLAAADAEAAAMSPAPPLVVPGHQPPIINRYFDLKQAMRAKLKVTATRTTSFPGHENDALNKDFLKGTTGEGDVNRVNLNGIPDLVVSDDGEMAMEASAVDGTREVEAFFASQKVVADGQKGLKQADSTFTLEKESGQGLKVPDLATNKLHELGKVVGAKAGIYIFSSRPKGPNLEGPEQCIEMAEALIGTKELKLLLDVEGDSPRINTRDLGQQMLLYLGAYIDAFRPGGDHEGDHATSQKVAAAALDAPPPKPPDQFWDTPVIQVSASSGEEMVEFQKALGRRNARNNYRPIFTTQVEDPKKVEDHWEMPIQLVDEGFLDSWSDVLDDGDVAAHYISYAEIRKAQVKRPVDVVVASRLLEDRKVDLIDKINNAPGIFTAINKELGMNERASPDVGQGYEIFHKGDGSTATFPYHFAGVVAKSGPDSVTFENYARDRKSSTGDDKRMYFQMYGPHREVEETDTGIRHGPLLDDEDTAEKQEERELAKGSFHGKWKSIFVEAQTLVVGKNPT